MDIIQHGTQSIIVTDLFYMTIFGHSVVISNPWLAVLFFLIGTIPDLSGWLDGLIRGKEYRWNGMYKFFHEDLLKSKFYVVMSFIILFPGLVFHIFIDTFFHKPEGGWIDNGTMWNAIGWAITVVVIYFMYFH